MWRDWLEKKGQVIHYHGSPCSGPADQAGRFYAGRHAMVSFAYPEQLEIIAAVSQSFALDNGAFSAWKQGEPVDFDAYTAWVSQWSRHPGFAWCLIPDVIDGSEGDNDDMIYRWTTGGKTNRVASVPVWHFHESPYRLQALAGRFPLVALGSSGEWSQPGNDAWWGRVDDVMPYVCDEDGKPYCKLHGLRMLNPEIFTRMPFASADSTNAAQNAGASRRFGMYAPSLAYQRANVIADRIEAFNSATHWTASRERQLELFGA